MKSAAFLLLALSACAHAGLKWEGTSHRFMYERGKKVMKHEFTYTNTGKTTVRITEVKSGCACCTAARVSRKVIAPGEKGTVLMRVDVSGKDIPVAKPVVVVTDDGAGTPLVIHVDTADGKPLKVPKWGK